MTKLNINLNQFQTKIHVDEIKDFKFGRLTMIEEVEPTYTKKLKFLTWFKTKTRMVKCKCDCGKTCVVGLISTVNGNTKSCGCWINQNRQTLSQRITPEGRQRMLEAVKVSSNKPENKARVREMGLHNRKYEEKCTYCGKEEHYAHGLCRACNARQSRTGVLDSKEQRMARRLKAIEEKEQEIVERRENRIEKYNPTTPRGIVLLAKYKSGMTLDEIGREMGVSRQRVHQILNK